jgi:DNA-binding MarR family transcriptional regulator
MSRLADLLDVSLSNATGLIDRMEERGLVERVRVPEDRRVVLVRESAAGDRVREEIEALKHDQIRSILGRLDPAKLARMRGAVQDLREALADELEDAGHPDHVHNH